MPRDMQASFTSGELSPSLHSRVDISKYHSGLALCKNWFVHSHGGISTRPGFEYVGEAADHSTTSRLIPFQFSTTQNYILVFGDLTMRVIKDGGLVLESAQNITNVTAADPAVITATAHGYLDGETVYISGTGVAALDNKYFTVANKTANTFEIAGSGVGWSSGGTVARLFELVTPYLEADLFRLKFTQSADVMTITHPSYQQRELTRADHDDWAINTISFAASISPPGSLLINQVGVSSGSAKKQYRYVITSIAADGSESVASSSVETQSLETNRVISGATNANPCVITSFAHGYDNGDLVYISGVLGMTDINGRYFTVANKATNTFELTSEDSTAYPPYTGSGEVQRQVGGISALSETYGNQVSWASVAGAEYYGIYKEVGLDSGIFGFIGEADGSKTIFTDYNLGPDLSVTPPNANNPFDGADDYPSCTTYHQQRLFFGATNNAPQSIWATRTSDYDNMDTSRPVRDDDSIQATLASNMVNEVRHLLSLGTLLVLTSGGEWRIDGEQDGVVTPANFVAKRQGTRGSSHVPPLIVGETALFIQSQNSRVRDLSYVFQSDKYMGNDLSVMSEHLFYGHTIVDWCYAEEPFGLVWAVRDDGVLLSLAYLKEHEVWGWSQHETDGLVESVSSIQEGNEDAVYAVIKRVIGGSDKRYIERLHSRQFIDIEDAFCVDSGLTYDGASTTSITGLDHLEGEAVAILADGNVVNNLVVTSGEITLPNAATKVHIGLPYTCDIKTLPVDFNAANVHSRKKCIPRVAARVRRTRGLNYGQTFNKLYEAKERDVSMGYDDIPAFTGEQRIIMNSEWTDFGDICIRQKYPLPATILAIIPEVEVNE